MEASLVVVFIVLLVLVTLVSIGFGIALKVQGDSIDELKAQLARKDDDMRVMLAEEHQKQDRLAALVKTLKDENARLASKLLAGSAPGPALDVLFKSTPSDS